MASTATPNTKETESTLMTESAGSSPTPKESSKKVEPAPGPKVSVGTKYTLKSEVPALPVVLEPAFAQNAADNLAAGNQAYVHELKEHGRLGLFFKRAKTTPTPTYCVINPIQYFNGIRFTLRKALVRLHRLKKDTGDADFEQRVDELGDTLATGCVIRTFMKLQALTYTDVPEQYIASCLRRPRASGDLPIPTPYAFAIQQLGAVNVADLTTDLRIVPCFPSLGHSFGLPLGVTWNPNAYAQAVEYARNLGMRFNIVDQKVKNGTAWWLFRQFYSEGIFELQCIIPETNYTDSMAATHTLFLTDDDENPSNPFVDISQFKDTYGIMLQNPHPGINLSTFEAVAESSSEIWSNV